jgi:PAS domain-containing protein
MSSTLREEERALYLRAIFDGIPTPLFLVDEDVRIQDFNAAAEEFLGSESATALDELCGEVFHCINSEEHGCGKGESCHACVIRNSVKSAAAGKATHRKRHVAELRTPNRTVTQELLISATLLPYTETPRVLLVLEDISRIVSIRKSQRG